MSVPCAAAAPEQHTFRPMWNRYSIDSFKPRAVVSCLPVLPILVWRKAHHLLGWPGAALYQRRLTDLCTSQPASQHGCLGLSFLAFMFSCFALMVVLPGRAGPNDRPTDRPHAAPKRGQSSSSMVVRRSMMVRCEGREGCGGDGMTRC